MKRLLIFVVIIAACSSHVVAQDATLKPWAGKYPMSFFTKTRTTATVGEGRLSVALKLQSVNCDEMVQGDCYEDMTDADKFDQFKSVLTMKYGWTKNQHLALGLPYLWTDFESSTKSINSDGVANIFVFNKWRVLDEAGVLPALAFDVWYYFDSGDSVKKLGSSDDSVKLAFQISKAWKRVSIHVNPAYRWNMGDGCDVGEVNVGSYCNLNKILKLGMEYNFTDKEEKGECHDLVPGVLWKPSKTSSVKLGAVVNLDGDMKYRDNLGVVMKLFYKFF